MTKLIGAVSLLEELTREGESLDVTVLQEAIKVQETDLSEPVDGDTLLAELLNEGLLT